MERGDKNESETPLAPCKNISQRGIFVPGKVVAREFLTLSKFSTVNNEDHLIDGRKRVFNVNLKKEKFTLL